MRNMFGDLKYAFRTMLRCKGFTAVAGLTPRFRALLTGSFATIALLLAGIGLYGLISYSVS